MGNEEKTNSNEQESNSNEQESNSNEQESNVKNVLFNKWSSEQREAIQALQSFIDKTDYKDIDKDKLNELITICIDEKKKKILLGLIDEQRNDLLIEILRPFETGNIGTRKTKAKLNLYKSSNDEKYSMNNLEGYIYDYEHTDDGVLLTFRITNERMRKLDKLFVVSNFIFDDLQKAYIPDLEKTERNLIDEIYYPYDYYFETTVSEKEAEKWLIHSNNQFFINQKENHFNITIRDLGLLDESIYEEIKNEEKNVDKEEKRNPEDYTSDEINTILNKAQGSVEDVDIDTISDYLDKQNNNIEKLIYKSAVKRISESYDNCGSFSLGLGKAIFVDDKTPRGGVAKTVGKSKGISLSDLETSVSNPDIIKTKLNNLFDGYEKAEIKIYRVALGNCITLRISYNASFGKKENLLILDAGVNENHEKFYNEQFGTTLKTIIDTTADALLTEIKEFKNGSQGDVYFIISHYHIDHYNIINRLLFKLKKEEQNDIPAMHCIMHFNQPDDPTALKQKNYMLAYFRKNSAIVQRNESTVYSKNCIKVLLGKETNDSSSSRKENQRSLLFQLRNTLLPSDSYYRNWHDDFGKIYRLDVNNESKLMYKKFKYILAPHHGWINDSKYDWINDTSGKKADDKSKKIVNEIYKKDYTQVYVLRHDDGSGNPPKTYDLMSSLGIDTNQNYDITKYDVSNPFTFTDQWDFTTMSDEEIVDECNWALIYTPKVGDKADEFLKNLHHHNLWCSTDSGSVYKRDENEVYICPLTVKFCYDIKGLEKDISNYFGRISYYNVSLNPSTKEFLPINNDLAISEVEFYVKKEEKVEVLYKAFYKLILNQQFAFANCCGVFPVAGDKYDIFTVFLNRENTTPYYLFKAFEAEEKEGVYTIRIRLLQKWSDAYEKSTP